VAKWNGGKWPGVWQRLYGSYGKKRDKWKGSHVAMNVATNGMANYKKAMTKSVENCMAVIVQESGVWQNRMAAFGQECGKWHGSTGSAKRKKLRDHMMSTIFSCMCSAVSFFKTTYSPSFCCFCNG
jgi:hypothetical protein